jgi:hypothetical protein
MPDIRRVEKCNGLVREPTTSYKLEEKLPAISGTMGGKDLSYLH